jgi:hypothetical protein
MLDESSGSIPVTVQADALCDALLRDDKKAAAVSAIETLRAHGNAGIERNLGAAAAIASLKAAGLPRGEFGRFCTDELQISSTYRARLLRLHEVSGHVPDALAWAATQKHRLAECQSAQNLIKVVNDWLNRDKRPKPTTASKTQEGRPGKDNTTEPEPVIQELAALVREREKAISELESELANRDDAIADLRRLLTECEQDIVSLRDPLSDEARDRALSP